MKTWSRVLIPVIAAAASCSSTRDGEQSEQSRNTEGTLTGAVMRPTSDITTDQVVGVGDATNLYLDVDDVTADDSKTYVRGDTGVARTSHTVAYSGAPAGTVTDVTVSYRAYRGSAQGTAQELLYDGTTLIGTGKVNTQGSAWATFADTFTGLNVASANTLRTKVVLTNTTAGRTHGVRYTQISLQPTFTATAPPDAGTDSGCSPTTCAAQGKNCGSVSDGCGGALSCGACAAPLTCGGGGVPNVCGGGAASLCGSSTAPRARYAHVVVVMEENRTWSTVGGVGFGDPAMPYLHALAVQCTTFADWTETNTTQNSLNQYIGLTSGKSNPQTVNDCAPSPTPGGCQSIDDNIFRQVRRSGGVARSYVEGATTGCSAAGNAAKHVPALYYYGTYADGGVTHADHDFCNTEVRPLAELDVNSLPTFAMITPNLCNDGHDCGNGVVDGWAKGVLPKILGSASYASGDTLVVLLYDEDHPVPNLLMAPTAHVGTISTVGLGSHAAMLSTWESMLGLPVLSGAADLRSAAQL